MNCPQSELLAAHAEGRLDAAESAELLEHCSECETCRRELVLLELAQGSTQPSFPLPARVKKRARRAVLRLVERDRGTRRFTRAGAPALAYVAAGLIMSVATVLAYVRWRDAAARDAGVSAAKAQKPVHAEPNPSDSDTRPETSVSDREGEPLPPWKVKVNPPRPEPRSPDPGPVVVESAPERTEAEPADPAPRPSHVLETRALSGVQVTDLSGTLTLRRKGGREKERVSGVTRVGEGDVLAAEKPASFRLEGGHAVVLGENASVSLAYVAQEQAPFLQVHSGEAFVDSGAPTRWIVTDGRVSVAVNRTVARFSAGPGSERLSLAALTEPLYVRPDGGTVHRVRAGEELRVGRSSADIIRLESGAAQKKNGLYESARPRQRTIFYTSCDPADAQRGQFFVQDGSYFKNEAILSRERPGGRSCSLAASVNPRFSWRDNLVVRVRFSTNATVLQVALRIEEKRVTLTRNITLDRKSANQWLTVDIPLNAFTPRRDEGAPRVPITVQDKLDGFRFSAQQQDVFGDQKVYVLIDDLQVFEKE